MATTDGELERLQKENQQLKQEIQQIKHKVDINDSLTVCEFNNVYTFFVPKIDPAEKQKLQSGEGLKRVPIEDLKSLKFNMFEYSYDELILCLVDMFQSLGLLDKFNISTLSMKCFLLRLKASYRQNPFHNFLHSFTVTHMVYFFLTNCGVQEQLKELEILALLLSALCHDLDHPGLSNGYHQNTHTSLAILYNNSSPLENHHSSCAWLLLLQKGETNILEGLKPEELKELRKIMVESILSTDMAKHFDIAKKFEGKLAAGEFDLTKPEDRILTVSMLVKSADISNEVRPWPVSASWADVLLEEFFSQGDTERRKGMPVTPFMDREKVNKPKTQIGFINAILLPTFQSMCKVFPGLQICVDSITQNREEWAKMLEST